MNNPFYIGKENEEQLQELSILDAVDKVVIESLKHTYLVKSGESKTDCDNLLMDNYFDILEAIKIVLMHYMSISEFDEWYRKVKK